MSAPPTKKLKKEEEEELKGKDVKEEKAPVSKPLFIPRSFVQLYRRTSMGNALTMALDEMLAENRIDEETALRILDQFDRSMYMGMRHRVRSKGKFRGTLDEFRLVDAVWTWVLTDAVVDLEGTEGPRTIRSNRMKIIAMPKYEEQ